MRTIVWFRGKDLRISDHAPLRAALEDQEVICLFVLDPHFFAPPRASKLPHRMQFLLDGLESLAQNIAARGSKLWVVEGRSIEVLPRLAREWKVDRVVAQRWTEPFGRLRDTRIGQAMDASFELFEGETLNPPGTLRSGSGTPYAVYSAFARAFRRSVSIGRPLPSPKGIPAPPDGLRGPEAPIPTCASLGLTRNENLQAGGERAARARLRRFIANGLDGYDARRDRMDVDGTSRLSADLKFGTVSPRQVWHAVASAGDRDGTGAFLNELVWREFSHSTLWDRPELLEQPFRSDFAGFPWSQDEHGWTAWAEGKTGYPIVDAAARQLIHEGFVHNRARMVSASFLTKHLLIDYRRGEAHYLKLLTDGDWAQNNAGWQWSAGCGCDAQPYFRVFNPVLQGKKFDPDGAYVRRWVPELGQVPDRWIHRPWEAPPQVLADAGVTLGEDYPHPIVDHRTARERFLETARAHLAQG